MEKQYTAMLFPHWFAVCEKVLKWGRRKIQPPVLTCSEKNESPPISGGGMEHFK